MRKEHHSKIKKPSPSSAKRAHSSSPSPARRSPSTSARDQQYAYVQIPREWRTVTGTHAIAELIQVRPKSIQMAWLKQGWESSQDLKKLAQELKARNIPFEARAAGFLDKFASSNQGAILFSSQRPQLDWSALEQASRACVMVLDGLEDPHNLGAILRTGWLMGVQGVLIPEDRSVGLTSTVHKVACGGAEHVPVEAHVNFANPLEELKKKGFWVFGLSHQGKRSLFDLEIPDKVVWCVGSEEKGLRSTTERLCDELIQIPQASAAASYNASVAAAVALTETLRVQRHKKL
jgi:23S rRNA (guanosine2251-2'-O)-methyltransferase